MTNSAQSEDLWERIAFSMSSFQVRQCVKSLRSGKDDWTLKKGEAHRVKPYPMGFYANDPRLYWAIGLGMSWHMFPWERWLVMRTFHAAREKA